MGFFSYLLRQIVGQKVRATVRPNRGRRHSLSQVRSNLRKIANDLDDIYDGLDSIQHQLKVIQVTSPTDVYTLIYRNDLGEDAGSGYVISDEREQRYQWRTLPESRLISFPVVGTKHRPPERLQHPSFSPGNRLALVPELNNPYDNHAVAVYNSDRSLMVGYVPRERAKRIAKLIADNQVAECFSVWQKLEKRRRVYLRALLVGSGCEVDFNALEKIAEGD